MPTTTTNRSSGTHRRPRPVESRDPWGEDSAWDFRLALPGFFAKVYPPIRQRLQADEPRVHYGTIFTSQARQSSDAAQD